MPTNTERTPQPRGSAPRPWNVAPSLSICSGRGKACGPQHSIDNARLKNGLTHRHTHMHTQKGKVERQSEFTKLKYQTSSLKQKVTDITHRIQFESDGSLSKLGSLSDITVASFQIVPTNIIFSDSKHLCL